MGGLEPSRFVISYEQLIIPRLELSEMKLKAMFLLGNLFYLVIRHAQITRFQQLCFTSFLCLPILNYLIYQLFKILHPVTRFLFQKKYCADLTTYSFSLVLTAIRSQYIRLTWTNSCNWLSCHYHVVLNYNNCTKPCDFSGISWGKYMNSIQY